MRRTFILGGVAAMLPLLAKAQVVVIDPPEAFLPVIPVPPDPIAVPPAKHPRKKHHKRH